MQLQVHLPWRRPFRQGLRRRALIASALLSICLPGAGRADSQGQSTLDVSACRADTGARLNWLVERVDSRQTYAKVWWRGWIGFYATGMVVQSVRAGLEDNQGQRADLIVSAVKALGGTTRLFFYRPVARLGADPLRAEPLPDQAACLARVEQGEALLRQAADESGRRWNWTAHLVNVGVNMVGAVIVTQAFHEKDGWGSAGLGIAVGEAMLWSHPWTGRSDLEEYQANFAVNTPPRTSWALVPNGMGLSLQVRF